MLTTFCVDVDKKWDILARVVMLFHRRAVPIHSLVMAAGSHDTLRISLIAELEEMRSIRMVADLYKLVNVRLVEISNPEQLSQMIQLVP